MPPLHFGRYNEIASQVAERLMSARGADPLRAWGVEVIVASRGVAESISRALLACDSRPIAQLQLQSLETLARRVLNDAGEYPRVASDAEWNANIDRWLPSESDRAFVASLMGRVVEPGKFANWIAPPPRGINNLPIDFEYIRFN